MEWKGEGMKEGREREMDRDGMERRGGDGVERGGRVEGR